MYTSLTLSQMFVDCLVNGVIGQKVKAEISHGGVRHTSENTLIPYLCLLLQELEVSSN